MQRWVPKGFAGKPVYVFETGGTHRHPEDPHRLRGLPHRLRAVQRHAARRVLPARLELADARPVRPAAAAAGGRASGAAPRRHLLLRRSRSALGHQADQEGLERAPGGLQGPRDRSGGDDPPGRPRHPCMFTTPKLLESLALRLESMGTTHPQGRHHGIFSGGTEFTPQWNRFAHEELLDGAYMTPTYGNTLMGLAASAPTRPAQQLQDHLLRAAAARGHRGRRLRRPDQASSTTAQTGRVKLTTLTKEFFMPGFLERDEGEREPPYEQYPVGRRQRRAPVPRARRHNDGRRVLMIHLPVLRWGQPYTSMDVDEVVHFSTGEPIAQGQPRQRRPHSARHAQGAARARRAARDPDRRADRARRQRPASST